MALKIKIEHVNEKGEKGIEPETMKLLLDFAEHKRFCPECVVATDGGTGNYCSVGSLFVVEILKRPDVEYVEE